MTRKQIDILHLDWPNSERDLNISIPVLVYLKKKYGYNILSKNIYNGLHYLIKYKPKVLFLSNAIGADINYLVSKYAYLSGIKVVTLTSEGNFVKGQMNIFLWGWNKEKKFYHHQQNVWSHRALNIAVSEYPEFKEIAVVGGATGFDKYQLFKQLDKKTFFEQNKLKGYNNVVGITSFGFFEHVHNETYAKKHKIEERFGKEQIAMYKEDFKKLKTIYKKLVQSNPDILFVIRTHPLTRQIENTEFSEIYNLKNVFVSTPGNPAQCTNNNTYSVIDCIAVSDMWIAYESTTILEAWLLGKTTFVINPSTYDFIREMNYKGCIKAHNFDTLNAKMLDYLKTKESKEFNALKEERATIIKDTIGYSDGKNHKRTAENVHKFIQSINNQTIDTGQIPRSLLKEHRWNYIKQKSKLYQWYNPYVNNVYKQNDAKRFTEMYKKYNKVITF